MSNYNMQDYEEPKENLTFPEWILILKNTLKSAGIDNIVVDEYYNQYHHGENPEYVAGKIIKDKMPHLKKINGYEFSMWVSVFNDTLHRYKADINICEAEYIKYYESGRHPHETALSAIKEAEVAPKDGLTNKELKAISRILSFKDKYTINMHFYDGDFSVCISRDDVDLFSSGGEGLEEIATSCAEFLERINRKK